MFCLLYKNDILCRNFWDPIDDYSVSVLDTVQKKLAKFYRQESQTFFHKRKNVRLERRLDVQAKKQIFYNENINIQLVHNRTRSSIFVSFTNDEINVVTALCPSILESWTWESRRTEFWS